MIDEDVAAAITEAADEVIAGELDDQLPVDVFQTGSGTSSNMNANGIIANRVAEIMGEGIGDRVVHPSDHVNFGQSSNGMIPTAMHVAPLEAVKKDLLPAPETFIAALGDKKAKFNDVVKTNRTHSRDATPVRPGQEFDGYRTQVGKGVRRVENVREHLGELALDSTAVDTGLNTHPEFPTKAAEYTTEETGVEFREVDSHFEAQAVHDAMNEAHDTLRTVAGSPNKIANDLCLLASGPRNELGELEQPGNQPGSSIMPGKTNPVVTKAVNQVHKQVISNDAAVSASAAEGQIDLNLYKPVLAHNFLESTRLLASSSEVLAERLVVKLETSEEHCRTRVGQSVALVTVLDPIIGYDKALKVAKKALAEDKSVRQVAVDGGYFTKAGTDEVFNPEEMTHHGILDDD